MREQIFARLLPVLPTGSPSFGVAGDVPLVGRGTDTTEIDMRCGKVIFESKLTEADFTSRFGSAESLAVAEQQI